MSVLGWGDVSETGTESLSVGANLFPWTELADKIDFSIFRGLVSGILSGCLNKEIKFVKIKKDLRNSFSVIISR